MATYFDDLFEKLLEDGQVDVAITGSQASVLRTSLSRKWNTYKRQYDSLGFLTDERKNCVLSMSTVDKGDGITATRYSLKVRATRIEYKIL